MPFATHRIALGPLGAALSLVLAGPSWGQLLTPEKGFHVTDGVVETIEVVGDSVYVGGHFQHVGVYTGPLAPLSISAGTVLPGFPEANDWIFGLAPDGAGGWFVGGDFTEIGGVARNHVAHVLPDLTVDPAWDANTNNRVYGFAIHGSNLYMHGFFNQVGAAFRNRIASVDLASGAVTSWDPNPTSGGVEDIFLDGDTLYVAGTFSMIAGEARRMAAFDLTTGDLTAFNPDIGNQVESVVAKDGVVYAGGRFTNVGGVPRNRLAAFDAATSALLPWDPNATGTVHDLALGETTLYAGGAFSHMGGVYQRALAEIDLTTGSTSNTIGGTTGEILTVLVHGDSLYVGGNFVELDTLDRRYLGGFDRTTGAVLDTPSPLDVVNALAAAGNTLFVGGEFGAAVGVDRSRFAAFHANTLELLPWAPSFQDIVWDLEANATQDTLYVGGRFHSVDGATREQVASFDLTTGALTGLSPAVNGDVYDIAVTESTLYLGGSFSQVNGAFRADLASVDRVSGALNGWNPGSDGLIYAVSAVSDTIFVGGVFFTLGDSARANVAAVDATTGQTLEWGTSLAIPAADEVECILPFDHPSYANGGLLVGGDFLNTGIGLRRGAAALHRNTGNTLYSWNAFLGPSFTTAIKEFAIADGLVYMAGNFRGVLMNEADGVAAVDIVTGRPSPWLVDAANATSIALSDSMVFVGGYMTEIQGSRHTHLAAFRRDTEPPLPASSLVATPGTVDKRIHLAWGASASSDVKDYLVYRTTTAGADTTGRQIAVTPDAFHVDNAPAYLEYFYRVFARDHAHNLGPASNEDSAVAPEILPPVPNVATAIHQNPVLSQYADIVVVSDSLLMAPPVVNVILPPDTMGTPVPMALLPGAVFAYQGPFEFEGSGVFTLQTSVVTSGGDPFEFERDFTATLVQPAQGGTVHSASGEVTLTIPSDSVREPTYFLVEDVTTDPASPTVRLGPNVAFTAGAWLEFAYDPARFPDPAQLRVARMDDGLPTPLPSRVVPERNVMRAEVDRLGEFRLIHGADLPGSHSIPVRFAVHANHPNPFRPSTTLAFDLPQDGLVRAVVYDVNGRRIDVLMDDVLSAGRHTVSWNGRDQAGQRVAAGVYFARVTASGTSRAIKMVLLR